MSNEKMVRAMRVAFRQEGKFWNVYFAPASTMEGALMLGSIRMTMCDDKTRERFKALFSDSVQKHIKDLIGVAPVMVEEPAPEHERSGHA